MQLTDRDRVLVDRRWYEVAVWRDDFIELVDMSVPECRFATTTQEVIELTACIQEVQPYATR